MALRLAFKHSAVSHCDNTGRGLQFRINTVPWQLSMLPIRVLTLPAYTIVNHAPPFGTLPSDASAQVFLVSLNNRAPPDCKTMQLQGVWN